MKPWWKQYRSYRKDECGRSTRKASRVANRVCRPPGRAPTASPLFLWVMAWNVIAASTPSSASSSAARPTSPLQKAWRSRPKSESSLHGLASLPKFLCLATVERFSFRSRRRRSTLVPSPGDSDGRVYFQGRKSALDRQGVAGLYLRNGGLFGTARPGGWSGLGAALFSHVSATVYRFCSHRWTSLHHSSHPRTA